MGFFVATSRNFPDHCDSLIMNDKISITHRFWRTFQLADASATVRSRSQGMFCKQITERTSTRQRMLGCLLVCLCCVCTRVYAYRVFSFLDYLMKANGSRKLNTSIYRNPKHSDRCQHFSSAHPQCLKRALISSRENRVKKLCDDSENKEELRRL